MRCSSCGQEPKDPRRLFCPCGKLLDAAGLRNVRVAGWAGVQHNPKFDAFWASGDPADLP